MITMTVSEQRRVQVVTRVLAGSVTLGEAAVVLGLSVRQVRRLKGAYATEGPAALVHGNRGRASPRRLPPAVQERVVQLYRERYAGCNYQHFTELLAQREELSLSPATVGRVLNGAGLRSPQRQRRPKHRMRRARMPAEGMLLQADGSPYRWLGPEGPRWTLISYVDDATSAPVAGVFREQEDAAGYFLALREIVATRGVPAAIYHDRHSIFHAPGSLRPSLEEQLAGDPSTTQYGRLLAELGVASIPAYSPQAKGRVERPWRTHQDRLVAELRLADIRTLEQANGFLPGYLARYAARFGVAPLSAASAYVAVDSATDLDRLFCFKYRRRVAPDHTVQFAGGIIQVPAGPGQRSYARALVEVHERFDGSRAVYAGSQRLALVPAPAGAPPLLRTRRQPGQRPRLRRALPSAAPPAAPVPVAVDGGQRAALSTGPVPPHTKATRPKQVATTPGRDHPWRKAPIGQNHGLVNRT